MKTSDQMYILQQIYDEILCIFRSEPLNSSILRFQTPTHSASRDPLRTPDFRQEVVVLEPMSYDLLSDPYHRECLQSLWYCDVVCFCSFPAKHSWTNNIYSISTFSCLSRNICTSRNSSFRSFSETARHTGSIPNHSSAFLYRTRGVIFSWVCNHFSRSSFAFLIDNRFSSYNTPCQSKYDPKIQTTTFTRSSFCRCVFHALNNCFFSLTLFKIRNRGSCWIYLTACSHEQLLLILPSLYYINRMRYLFNYTNRTLSRNSSLNRSVCRFFTSFS